MVETTRQVEMSENRIQFLEEIQEIIDQDKDLYEAFAKEKFE
ncbi:hypothetical protein [Nitrosopumilus ureiphilus]|nr:hypothetical protein [Nitrosopumilus ureiphilus]